MARSNGNGETDSNIVTPVNLAKELSEARGSLVRPQMIFGWVRAGTLPSHKCVCGHTYLLRDEVAEFLAAREAKAAEKAAKVAEELEGEAVAV